MQSHPQTELKITHTRLTFYSFAVGLQLRYGSVAVGDDTRSRRAACIQLRIYM